jgi:hypothetical protein
VCLQIQNQACFKKQHSVISHMWHPRVSLCHTFCAPDVWHASWIGLQEGVGFSCMWVQAVAYKPPHLYLVLQTQQNTCLLLACVP